MYIENNIYPREIKTRIVTIGKRVYIQLFYISFIL